MLPRTLHRAFKCSCGTSDAIFQLSCHYLQDSAAIGDILSHAFEHAFKRLARKNWVDLGTPVLSGMFGAVFPVESVGRGCRQQDCVRVHRFS